MTEKRFALIIASYQYQDTDLRQLVAPAQDAEALARVLKDPTIGGFEVQTLLNEPSYKVNQEIEAFFADRRRDDLLLLYFSGHGIKDEEGRLYFATTNTRRKLLRTTAVPATLVNDVMQYSRSRRQVLLLDCCYSGAFARGMVAKADKAIGTKERFEGRGRVVLTASDAMQYAFEGDEIVGEGVRSLFTHILVHGLETGEADLNGDGRISPDELYNYVYERVTDETPQQRPGRWAFDVQGEIIIARNPVPPAPKVSLPGWITEALASGDFAARLAVVGKLDQLSQGEDEALAAIARAELERLSQEDENSMVRGAAAGALGVSPVAVPAKPSPARPPPIVEKAKPKQEPELHPSLALKLSVKPQTVDTGGEATWTATLRNDGEDDLRHVTVRRGRTLLDESFDLAAGKGRRFTFTTTYKTEGQKIERVTATGITGIGGGVREEASATVQVRPPRPVTPKPEPAPKRKPPAKPTPDVLTLTSPIQLELVRVPAGEFLMGSDPAKDKDAGDNEQPQHRVYVSEFYIGKYPVTKAQYVAFVKATGHDASEHRTWLVWGRDIIPPGKEDYPVIHVSWDGAVAFCEWLSRETGKPFHLPTEAEWEKAARGTDGRIYPWGNEWDKTKLNSKESGPGGTTPVGQYSPAGDSPYGAADMSGNVWECCADWYDRGEYQRRAKSTVKDPQGPKNGTFRVLRGGAFFDDVRKGRCAYRSWYGPPDYHWDCIGFRVVVAPVPSGPFDFAQDKL
jgi:formylglycine-generating enzyme required for sulfatase activity